MHPRILTITLNPAIDRIIRHDRPLFFDASFAGGKGVNVARAARALGASVRAIGMAGGPEGCRLDALLDEEKIPHRFSLIQATTRVNVTTVSIKGGLRRKIGGSPVVTKKERDAFEVLFHREARRSSAVVFSGSLPLKFPLKAFSALITQAQRSGSLTVVDTSGAALRAILGLGVDIIKPNRREAEEVLGFRLSSRTMLRKALRSFIRCGIKRVLISLGRDGIAASDGDNEFLLSTPIVTTGHAVGCGDAALAGFLSAHFKGKDFNACTGYAAACGYANALADVPGGIIKKDAETAFRTLMKRKVVWL
jgi:1-phosphofructokinase family hexose kinase